MSHRGPDFGRGRDALLRDPAWHVLKTYHVNIRRVPPVNPNLRKKKELARRSRWSRNLVRHGLKPALRDRSGFHVFRICNVGSRGSVSWSVSLPRLRDNRGTGQILPLHVFWTCHTGSRGSASLSNVGSRDVNPELG